MRFYLDFESTNCLPYTSRIVQIGCLCENGESFKTFVCADQPMHTKASEITGITDGQLQGAPSCRRALELFFSWLNTVRQGQVVTFIAHNGYKFDYPLLYSEMRRSHMAPAVWLRNNGVEHFFDSYVWLQENIQHLCNSMALGSVHEMVIHKKIDNAHDALSDCIALKAIIEHLETHQEELKCEKIDWVKYSETLEQCMPRYEKKYQPVEKDQSTRVSNMINRFLKPGVKMRKKNTRKEAIEAVGATELKCTKKSD